MRKANKFMFGNLPNLKYDFFVKCPPGFYPITVAVDEIQLSKTISSNYDPGQAGLKYDK